MPLLLIAIGIVLMISAVKGTTSQLFTLLQGDLTGPNNYLIWLGAVIGVGLFGYVRPLRPIAGAMLVLIVTAMVLSNKGFFAQFASAFESTTSGPPSNNSSATSAPQNYLSQALASIGGTPSGSGASQFQLPTVPTIQGSNLFSDLNFGGSAASSAGSDLINSLF